MGRFLKAELNTIYRKPKLYVLLSILTAAFILGIVVNFLTHGKVDITIILIEFFHPFLVIILVSDVTHKEYKFNTMKNLIGSGFTRSQIYTGKLIVTMIVAFMFILIEKAMQIIYLLIKHDFAKKFFWKAELVDMVRQFCMFGIIFIICMLITSDALSLLASFGYGILLSMFLGMVGIFVPGISDKVAERISAACLVSSSAYVKSTLSKDGYVIGKYIDKGELIWCGVGIIVALLALQGGYMLFKRKEFK